MPLLILAIGGFALLAFVIKGAANLPNIHATPGGATQTRLPGGIPQADIDQAVAIAVGSELYPSRLRAFAATLQPDQAGPAAALMGKAAMIDAGLVPGRRGQ